MAIAANVPMIATTIINSISVKPPLLFFIISPLDVHFLLFLFENVTFRDLLQGLSTARISRVGASCNYTKSKHFTTGKILLCLAEPEGRIMFQKLPATISVIILFPPCTVLIMIEVARAARIENG
jgi:hypothetical protein